MCEKILFLLSHEESLLFLLCYDFRNAMYNEEEKENEEIRIAEESKGRQDFTSDEIEGRNTVHTKKSIDNTR